MTGETSGSPTTPTGRSPHQRPRAAGGRHQGRQRARRVAAGPAGCGSPTAPTTPSNASTPPPASPAAIDVGDGPDGLAVDERSVWVANGRGRHCHAHRRGRLATRCRLRSPSGAGRGASPWAKTSGWPTSCPRASPGSRSPPAHAHHRRRRRTHRARLHQARPVGGRAVRRRPCPDRPRAPRHGRPRPAGPRPRIGGRRRPAVDRHRRVSRPPATAAGRSAWPPRSLPGTSRDRPRRDYDLTAAHPCEWSTTACWPTTTAASTRRLRSRPRHLGARAHRRRKDVHVQPAAGHPLLHRRRGPRLRLRPRCQARPAHTRNGRPDFYAGIIGARPASTTPRPVTSARALTPTMPPGRITFHLRAPDPQFLYKLTLLVVPTHSGPR